MPPRTQRNPAYLTISTVFGSGCPRSGKVVTMPMLFRKSVAGMAVVGRGSRPATVRTILLKTCSSKFLVPSSTSWLNEVVVASVNLTVAPAPLFQSLLVMLQAPSDSRVIVRRLRPPPSRTDAWVASISSAAQVLSLAGVPSATLAHCTAHFALQRWTSKT